MYTFIRKGQVLYFDSENNSVSSYKGRINYEFGNNKGSVALPVSVMQRFLLKSRLCERALRLEPRFGVAVDGSNILLSFHGAMYRVNIHSGSIIVEQEYRKGMNNPLKICSVDFDGYKSFLYGEYWENPLKDEVKIFKRDSLGVWKSVFAFPRHSIKHIHQIVYDNYKNRFLIATGDDDNEAGIWESDLDFHDVKPIIRGKQCYRSCFVVPTETGFYYATDSPTVKNHIYSVTERKELYVTKVADLPGPCIYGKQVGKDIIFATSVEPDYTLSKWRSRFSRKISGGIEGPYSYLLFGNIREGFKIIDRIKKDWHSMWLFQLGNISFSDGDSKRIFATGHALKKIDGISVEINRNDMLKE